MKLKRRFYVQNQKADSPTRWTDIGVAFATRENAEEWLERFHESHPTDKRPYRIADIEDPKMHATYTHFAYIGGKK